MVELHGGDSIGSGFSTEFSYTPAIMMWPGGVASEGLTWTSSGSQSGTWSGGGTSGTLSGTCSSEWELTGVGLTYDLDSETLTDCFTYARQSSTSTGTSTTTTDEIGIYCGSLYGLVWTDVVTTTTTDAGSFTADSVTELLSLSLP